MKNKSLSIFLLIIFSANYELKAQDILDGWYFNPDQPGSGFNVNTQADTTGIALFDFEQGGDNQWAIAVDAMEVEGDFNVFEGVLQAPVTGACFDCPFVPNDGNASGDTIRIAFQILAAEDGNTVAEVTLRGQTETYVRTLFRFSTVIDYLLSTWTFTQLINRPAFDGTINAPNQVIRFDTFGTLNDGSPFVSGNVISDDNQIATAVFTPNGGDFADGNIGLLAADTFGTLDQFWVFQAFKESLIGVTSIAEDPIDDVVSSPDSIFVGGRIGDTFNANLPVQGATEMLQRLAVERNEIKLATPEQQAAAEALYAKMKALDSE